MARVKNNGVMLIVLVIIAIGCGFLFLPVREWFLQFQGRILGLGALGPVVFVFIYVVLAVLLIPGSALTIGAGSIFGLRVGAITVIIAANLAAVCAFLLSRTFLRKKVEGWASGSRKFTALDRAIESEGFKVVLLARLSPVFPFTLLNYLLGLTRVRIGSYVLANLIGMLPGTFLYVYIGATARDALGGSRQALNYLGLLLTVVVVALITRRAKRAMAELDKQDTDETTEILASEAQ